jgi:hypothetical protein
MTLAWVTKAFSLCRTHNGPSPSLEELCRTAINARLDCNA